jgi:hypothetical protein
MKTNAMEPCKKTKPWQWHSKTATDAGCWPNDEQRPEAKDANDDQS